MLNSSFDLRVFIVVLVVFVFVECVFCVCVFCCVDFFLYFFVFCVNFVKLFVSTRMRSSARAFVSVLLFFVCKCFMYVISVMNYVFFVGDDNVNSYIVFID